MRILLRLFGLATLLALPPSEALACSCGSNYRDPALAAEADVIFSGVVLRERMVLRPHDEFRPAALRVEIAVRSVWKGAVPERLVVETGFGGGDCGIDFRRGESFLVYADRARSTGRLVTGLCSGTDAVASLKDHLRFLGAPRQQYDGDARAAGWRAARWDRLMAALKIWIWLVLDLGRRKLGFSLLRSPAFAPGLIVFGLGAALTVLLIRLGRSRSVRIRTATESLAALATSRVMRKALVLGIASASLLYWLWSLKTRWWRLTDVLLEARDWYLVAPLPFTGIAVVLAVVVIRRYPTFIRIFPRLLIPGAALLVFVLEVLHVWTSYIPWRFTGEIDGPGDTPLGLVALALFPPGTFLAPSGAVLIVSIALVPCLLTLRRGGVLAGIAIGALVALLFPLSWGPGLLVAAIN